MGAVCREIDGDSFDKMNDAYFTYTLVFCAGLLIAIGLIGPGRLFSITHLAGIYLVTFTATYLVRPLLTQAIGDSYQLTLLKIAGLDRVWYPMSVAVFLSLISFALGYRLPFPWRGRPTQVDRPLSADAPATPRSILVWCGILLVWGYTMMLLVEPVPGLRSADVPMQVTEGGTIYTTTTGYLVTASISVAASVVLLYAVSGSLFPSVLLALPWLVTRIYVGWGRSVYLFFLIAMVIVWALRRRTGKLKLRQLAVLIVFVIGGLALVPTLGSNREYFRQSGWSANDVIENSTTGWIDSTSPVAGFESTLYFLQLVPDHYPYAYGATYMYRYFIQWIPRILWREKPVPTDLVGWSDPALYGSAPGAIGDAYWNFGWPGIIIFFFLTGFILNWVEKRYEASEKSPAMIAAYAAFYATMIHLGRDSLFYMLPTYLQFWGPAFFIARWLEIKSRNVKANFLVPITTVIH